MNAARTYWRRSHPVKISRPAEFQAIHAELAEARHWDQIQAELREQIDAELERDFRQEERS